MALISRKAKYRAWPVTVTTHEFDEDTGAVAPVEQSFIARFTLFGEDRYLEIRRKLFGDEADEDNLKRLGNMPVAEYAALEAALFAELMCGWSAVQDEDGIDVPFGTAALLAYCTGHDGEAVRNGLNRAIGEIRHGWAPAKNFVTSPKPGPAPGEAEVKTSSTTTAALPA